ncbi:MAG: amidohydrolase family protein [Burkholderiales bacterium]|nr:amidohydrolase family protein [Burkholderiales bacterium]
MTQPPICQGPDPQPRRPKHAMPAGVVDCHCHVFEDQSRYPLVAARSYTPPLATLSDYLAMCEVLGIARTVQVNASVYGFDNSVSLDVIAELGQKRARGVAGVAPDVSAREIERLHKGGIRGVRLSTMVKGYGGTELIDAIAAKIKPYGWHVQLHVDKCAELVPLEQKLLDCPTPLVFDHLGRVRGGDSVNAPGFQALLRIIRQRNDCWVKISSWYRLSDSGPPHFTDIKPLVEALVAARPDRLVWGSNWPHPVWDGPMPNDGGLLDLFCEWVPDAAIREQILVTNPARLYGFE